MKKHGHNDQAFERFYTDPTPANAVRLARADHMAGVVPSGQFVDALALAVKQLEAYEAIMASLAAQPACKPGTPSKRKVL